MSTEGRLRIVVGLPQIAGDISGVLDAAREAEDAGAWGVSVFDHLWAPWRPEAGALEGWALLGLVARTTSRLRLVSLVTRTGVRPPALVVRQAELVQAASGGRLVLGLGVGDAGTRTEERRSGIVGPSREARLAEMGTIARGLRGEGDLPVRPWTHAPPLWVGGWSEDVLELAARSADGWHGWGRSVERFAEAAAGLRAGSPAPQCWWGELFDPRTADASLAALRDAGATGVTWAISSRREPDDRRALLDLIAQEERSTR